MNEILKDVLVYGSYLTGNGMSYISLLCAGNVLESKGEGKIESIERLEELLNKNLTELKIKEKVEAEFTPYVPHAIKKENKYYAMINIGDTEGMLRHELFHIRLGHCEKPIVYWTDKIKYLLW